MATKTLTIQLIADIENFAKGLNKVTKQLDDTAKTLTNFGRVNAIAFTALTGAIYGFAKAAQESEQQEQRLIAALRNQGKYTALATENLVAYAKAMSRASLFDDEAILSVESTLVAFGLQETQVKSTTKAILDYAQFTGKGLETAALTIGQAIGGATDHIRGVDVALNGVNNTSTRSIMITDALTRSMGGQAAAAAKGYGALNQMFNELKNVAEEIGKSLQPTVEKLAKTIRDMAISMQQNPMFADIAATVLLVAAALTGFNAIVGYAAGTVLKFISILVKLLIIFKTLGIFLFTNPIGWVILGITAAIIGLSLAFRNNFWGITDIVKNAFDYLYTQFKWFKTIVDWVRGIWETLPWNRGKTRTKPGDEAPAPPGGAPVKPPTKEEAAATAVATESLKTAAEDFTKQIAEGIATGSLDVNAVMEAWAQQVLTIWLTRLLLPLTSAMMNLGAAMMKLFDALTGGKEGIVYKLAAAISTGINWVSAGITIMADSISGIGSMIWEKIVAALIAAYDWAVALEAVMKAIEAIKIVASFFGFAGGSSNVPFGAHMIEPLHLASGTDTIPAMLTPGEMVIPKSIAQGVRSGDMSVGGQGGGAITVSLEGAKFYGKVPKETAYEIGEEIGRGIRFNQVPPFPSGGL
jgi:hypothetical protein